jgi:ankyrin repeat protein
MHGHLDVVKLLLEHGARPMYRSPSGRTRKGTTAVHEASETGRTQILKVLLEQPTADPNSAIGCIGMTPLYIACANGHTNCVKLLLENGAINYRKHERSQGVDTPLLIACTYDYTDIVRLLLQNTASNINDSDTAGRSPLFIAVKVRNLNVVRLLLEYNADINQAEYHFCNTPMHEAVKRERLDIVQELLRGGALLKQNHFNETPLCIAIEKGNTQIVRTIIHSIGSHVIFGTSSGSEGNHNRRQQQQQQSQQRQQQLLQRRGPLHYACSFLNAKINLNMIKLLHDLGADVNQRDMTDTSRATPLLICSRCSNCNNRTYETNHDDNNDDNNNSNSSRCKAKVAEYLIQRGADVYLADNFGRTPLHKAAQSGCVNMVHLLLRTRAKHRIDQTDMYRATPLHFAVMGCFSSSLNPNAARIVEILIHKEANVNHQDVNGMSSLHIASRKGAVDIVDVLLQHGADVNVTMLDGKSPLHVAVEAGHLDVVKLLVRHSTSIDQRDVRGWTPLAIACAHNNPDIVQCLMEVHVAGERGSMDHVKRLLLLHH